MRIFESILDDITASEISTTDVNSQTDQLSPQRYHFCLTFPTPFKVSIDSIKERFDSLFKLYTIEYNIVIEDDNNFPDNADPVKILENNSINIINRVFIEFNTRLNRLDPMFIIIISATLFRYYNLSYYNLTSGFYFADTVGIMYSADNKKYMGGENYFYSFKECTRESYLFLIGKLKVTKYISDNIFDIITKARAQLLDPRDIREYLSKRLKRRITLMKIKNKKGKIKK